MEKSVKFGFNLPSRDGDDIADINQISENFRIIEEKIYNKEEFNSVAYDTAQMCLDDNVQINFSGPDGTAPVSGSAVWQAIGEYFIGEGAVQIQNSMNTYFDSVEGATRIQTAIESSNAEMQSYKTNLMDNPSLINDVNYPTTRAVANYVTDQMGSIETALDSVIAIQNEIIGGGSV